MKINYEEKEMEDMCKNGDIFWAQLGEDMDDGSLQTGFRPVLIVSNDKANQYSPVVTIVPITSKIWKKSLPTHVFITGCGLRQGSTILVEQITSLNKSRLDEYVGNIRKTAVEAFVKKAIAIQLNL